MQEKMREKYFKVKITPSLISFVLCPNEMEQIILSFMKLWIASQIT